MGRLSQKPTPTKTKTVGVVALPPSPMFSRWRPVGGCLVFSRRGRVTAGVAPPKLSLKSRSQVCGGHSFFPLPDVSLLRFTAVPQQKEGCDQAFLYARLGSRSLTSRAPTLGRASLPPRGVGHLKEKDFKLSNHQTIYSSFPLVFMESLLSCSASFPQPGFACRIAFADAPAFFKS
jgi:hypothetical protein